MKKSKPILFIFFVLSLIIQILYFNNSDKFYKYGFAIGIKQSIRQLDVGIDLIYVVLPVYFIIFLMSGSIHKIKSGYGKLLIIRNYSKTSLYLKKCIQIVTSTALIVIFELFVYMLFNRMFQTTESNIFKSIVMYFIILSLIITLQGVLELFIMPHIANIIIFIYCFVSYFTAQIIPENVLLKTLLFPCLLFGIQNGAVEGNNLYYIYLCFAVILNLLFMIIGTIRFKKTDIF